MKLSSIRNLSGTECLSVLIFAAVFLVQTALGDQSQAYSDFITKARDQITSGDFLAALQTAQKTILQDNADYRGYYYAAYALFKQGMLDDAAEMVQDSLNRAPSEQKESIQKLVAAIAGQRSYDQNLKEADKADQEGLLNKAANLYTKAWLANTNGQAAGLKAAHLWAERLNNAQQAAHILHAVLASPRDSAPEDDASKLMIQIQPQLQHVFQQNLNSGCTFLRSQKYTDAATDLANAEELFPDRLEPHVYLSRARVALNDFDGMKNELLAAVRAGLTNSDPILSAKEFRAQLGNSNFAELMQDVFGPAEAGRIRAVEEKWAMFDQNVSDYQRAKEGFEAVAESLHYGNPDDLQSLQNDLKQTGDLIFNGKLDAAAEIFARAARVYSQAEKQAKFNGQRAELQQKLQELNDRAKNLQEKIDEKSKEFDQTKEDFLNSAEYQRIQLQATEIANKAGNLQTGLDWAAKEALQAAHAQLDPINDEIDRLQKEKDDLTDKKIPELKRQLQDLRE